MRIYHVNVDGSRVGPYTMHQLRGMWTMGAINGKTLVESDSGLLEAGEISEELEDRAERVGRVVVSGLDIPFSDMVTVMCKWALASIPAAIILFAVFAVAGIALASLLTALGMAANR